MIATRPAVAADGGFLEATFLVSLRQSITAARGAWNDVRERAQFYEQLELEHTRIVESDGIAVGFVMVWPSGSDLELHTICILPQHQAQGIGAETIRLVVQSAAAGNLGIVLSVLKANGRARLFFERHGFVQIGESAYHYQFRHVGISLAA